MKICTPNDWEKNTLNLNLNMVKIHPTLISIIQSTISSGRILEVGAQAGLDAEFLGRNGCSVTAVDYNNEAINLLSKKGNINVVKADGLNLPFQDSFFDLVYSQGLVEHFRGKELTNIMDEQKRVVRDKGHVLIDVPNTYSLNTIPKQILIMLGNGLSLGKHNIL